MASRRSSKANGAHANLLKMVNDQRARCKLTTLDNVMDHTGFSWVESMLEHARDLYQDHSSSIVSEADMNVNILRSPKKDKQKQKQKKITSTKKPSPYKKQRIPKASTPPRQPSKKVLTSPRIASFSSSTSTKVALQESSQSELNNSLQGLNTEMPVETTSTVKANVISVPEVVIVQPAPEVNRKLDVRDQVVEKNEQTQNQNNRKRKDEEEHEVITRTRQSIERDFSSVVEVSDVVEAEDVAEEEAEMEITSKVEEKIVDKQDNVVERGMVALGTVEDHASQEEEDEKEEEDEVEVSRVIAEEVKEEVKMFQKPIAQLESDDEESDKRTNAKEVASTHPSQAGRSDPVKGKTEFKAAITQLRNSLDDSMSSNDTKMARSDDVFSEGEAEPAPSSSSSGSSVPKPSLRERIDRFRAIFSPAPRPASSIPRLSPPKSMQSPPRPQLSSIAKPVAKPIVKPAAKPVEPKSPAKLVEATKSISKPAEKAADKSIEKPMAKVEAKAPLKSFEKPKSTEKVKANEKPVEKVVAKVVAPVSLTSRASPPKSPAKEPTSSALAPAVKIASSSVAATHTLSIKAAPMPPIRGSSFQVAAPVRVSTVKVAAPAPIKLSTQVKAAVPTVKVAAPSQPQPQPQPTVPIANPFQKAQLQQQQQALATTSHLRIKQQQQPLTAAAATTATAPAPSTAHIELEEPDSAYSDSEDEETVRRRLQHKPWETREGLAKALEEQATIDADMIFGIPHGAVPIDEILPAETEYARNKRARPRSSSATWSRDGLKQIEIDRYNERMGIQGPGVLLPITVQDDGSGTPSRSHRLSAIAQSAISQGQISRKLSQSAVAAARNSLSPVRPGTASVRSTLVSTSGVNVIAPSTVKYPQLTAGTPIKAKAGVGISASSQKPKVTRQPTTGASGQVIKPSTTKTITAKNSFQNGAAHSASTLQASRLANGGAKLTSTKK